MGLRQAEASAEVSAEAQVKGRSRRLPGAGSGSGLQPAHILAGVPARESEDQTHMTRTDHCGGCGERRAERNGRAGQGRAREGRVKVLYHL